MGSEVVRVRKVVDEPGLHVTMWCPGCNDLHAIWVRDPETGTRPKVEWIWNGNMGQLNVNESILVTGGSENIRCHSHIKAGQWRFLSDCTHRMAGMTVDMMPIPEGR